MLHVKLLLGQVVENFLCQREAILDKVDKFIFCLVRGVLCLCLNVLDESLITIKLVQLREEKLVEN